MTQFGHKRNNYGYTLLELIIVIGVVFLLVLAIYTQYSKRATLESVKNQTAYLTTMSNAIEKMFIASKVDITSTATEGYSQLNNTSAIAARVVPLEFVTGTQIKNLFGGNITLSSSSVTNTSGTLPAYSITLSNVPSAACTLLVTTAYANATQEIWIGTTKIKNATTSQTPIAAAANACASASNVTVDFRDFKLQDRQLSILPPKRNKDHPYYIASVGDVINSTPMTCAGGSAWTGSYCACPINTKWNGTSCTLFGSIPGWCNKGQTWSGAGCITTPSTPASYVHQNPNFNIDPVTNPTFAGTVNSVAAIYMGASGFNRPPNLPTVYPITQTTQGRYIKSLPSDIPSANITQTIHQKTPSQTCSGTNGHFDGRICQVCIRGSWSTTLLRCVTP